MPEVVRPARAEWAGDERDVIGLAKHIAEVNLAWVNSPIGSKGLAEGAEKIMAMQRLLEETVNQLMPPLAIRELYRAVKSAWESCPEHDYWTCEEF